MEMAFFIWWERERNRVRKGNEKRKKERKKSICLCEKGKECVKKKWWEKCVHSQGESACCNICSDSSHRALKSITSDGVWIVLFLMSTNLNENETRNEIMIFKNMRLFCGFFAQKLPHFSIFFIFSSFFVKYFSYFIIFFTFFLFFHHFFNFFFIFATFFRFFYFFIHFSFLFFIFSAFFFIFRPFPYFLVIFTTIFLAFLHFFLQFFFVFRFFLSNLNCLF